MEIDDFDFTLPQECIALTPARPRDQARLLHVQNRHEFNAHVISDLPRLLRRNDLLVVNNTAVIPAQLHAWRGSAKIGLTLDRALPNGTWHALARNARRLREGNTLTFTGEEITAEIESCDEGGSVTLRFSVSGDAFDAFLKRSGALALPPYISRPHGPTLQDESDYQTIFSKNKGAVAAPTAGLHFTPTLIDALAAEEIGIACLTLHVGAGTFLPVRTASLAAHKMHAEWGAIDEAASEAINNCRANGGRIVAVGTTTLRLLESACSDDGRLSPWRGETSIFITPGYSFRIVDALITNFHLPKSTLFMLVCAFAGTETMKAAYTHAIANKFRFYSYGDACLLERNLCKK